jgi:PPOX class probable F420-dependent enzyme
MTGPPEPVVLPDEVRALLDARNFAHVATVLPSGAPHSVPVWILREGDRVCFFTQPGSRKARNLARDPRVAVSLVDRTHPYRTAQLRGRVVETRTGDAALETIDRIAEKYTGRPFPLRSGVVYVVEPDRVNVLELPFRD